MSRDFELLQRLEREWGTPSSFPESTSSTAPARKQGVTLKVAHAPVSNVTRPGANLAVQVRGELTKLIFGTFLATPARKVVMFTGVEAGEHAKWAAACAADILADAGGGPVCLLDADLSAPTVHRFYSLPHSRGLVDLLAGRCTMDHAAIRAGENLWVIPAGVHPDSRPAVPGNFQQAISDILDQCEYIVIAAPDFGRFTEISTIGQATEGAVLVLDAVKTRRVTAQEAKSALEVAKVRVLGSVLSNAAYSKPEFPYF